MNFGSQKVKSKSAVQVKNRKVGESDSEADRGNSTAESL